MPNARQELIKLDYLDSLRGIAVMMVIFTHAGLYVDTSGLPDILRHLISFASRGVQLFYILSAFTLFYSLDRRSTSDAHRWGDFFIRRLFRIGPLWWLSVIAFLFLRNQYTFSSPNIVSNLFFVHGFHPQYINSIVVGGWSIAVEMVFYLLVPFCYFIFTSTQRTLIGIFWIYAGSRALIGILRHVDSGFSEQIWNEYLFYFLPNQLPVFLTGFLLFHLIIRKDELVNAMGYIHLVATLFLCYILYPDWFHSQNFLLVPFVWIVSRAPRFPLWNNALLQYLGKVSFSLYLVHFGAVMIVRYMDFLPSIPSPSLRFGIGFLVVASIATGIATLTWNGIEKPGQKLGSWIIRKWDRKN